MNNENKTYQKSTLTFHEAYLLPHSTPPSCWLPDPHIFLFEVYGEQIAGLVAWTKSSKIIDSSSI